MRGSKATKELRETPDKLKPSADVAHVFNQSPPASASVVPEEVQVQNLLDFFGIKIDYLSIWNHLHKALQVIIVTNEIIFEIKNMKPGKGKDEKQSNYIAAARNMLKLCGEYIEILKRINLVMNPQLSQHVLIKTPDGKEITVAKGIPNVELVLTLRELLASGMNVVLFGLENRLIESRLIMFMHPTAESIQNYLKFNREVIEVQIALLRQLGATSKPDISLWPVLNKDLGRVQTKSNPVASSVVILQKTGDLKVYDDSLIPELLPFISIFNEAVNARGRIQKLHGDADVYLAQMVQHLATDTVNQNALLKLIVLAVATNCYVVKNNISNEFHPKVKPILKDGVVEQISYLKDFSNNLAAVRPIWYSKLFKVINNIIYIKTNVEDIFCISEQLLFYCEIVFKHANKNNLELKKRVIELQIELLDTQNTMLTFVSEMCQEEYVKYFYLKNKSEDRLVLYNATAKNSEKLDNGEFHSIIRGIAIKDIKERNDLRKLALEGIILEFIAGQRKPEDADYFHAISGTELDQYLAQWEAETADEKAKEEKQPHLKSKQQKKHERERRQSKAKAAQADAEREKNRSVKSKPNETALVRKDEDEETSRMDGLLLRLNPRRYSAKDISDAIIELNKLILVSTNHELIFKALSSIGDTYSMIAGNDLNHSRKHPEKLVVDLKLALNYYSRAELALRKLNSISVDEHSHYYTWLLHSISIQQNLLDQYVAKFTRKSAELETSKGRYKQANPDKWYTNHEREDWTLSSKAVQERVYKKALEAANTLQDNCRLFATRVNAKVTLKVAHQAYGFEHYLSKTGKRELSEPTIYQLEDQVVANSAEIAVVLEPDKDGVLEVMRNPPTQNTHMVPHQEQNFTSINFNLSDPAPIGMALDRLPNGYTYVPPFYYVPMYPVYFVSAVTWHSTEQLPPIVSEVPAIPNSFQRLIGCENIENEYQNTRT